MERNIKPVKREECRNLKLKSIVACPEIKVKNKNIGNKDFGKLAEQKNRNRSRSCDP